MFKKALVGIVASFYLIGCGGGSSSETTSSITTFTVERGAVLAAIVKDSSGQIATNSIGSNDYTFEKEVIYPITVSGGYIDVDSSGTRTSSDVDLDMNLSTYTGTEITLISTIIGENRESNLETLSQTFSLDSEDLLALPSENKKTALLTNLIYKELETNDSLNIGDVVTKIKNNELGIKEDFDGFDLTLYENLSTEEFLAQTEADIINQINTEKEAKSSLPTYTGSDLTSKTIVNSASAYISSQCYTKTEDSDGKIHNPCYSCHINSEEPNYIDDWDLQESYAFSENSKINPFTNAFKDRTNEIAQISDEEILAYVKEDNYLDENGNIILAQRLKTALPEEWDFDYDGTKDGVWSGFVPDLYLNFDEEGFDKDTNGNYTGWRAFGYTPFLGTFWPTNGSTDDVFIRLPSSMMQDSSGNFSKEVYNINLAIVESMIKREDITIDEVDENDYGVDLDHNGVLERTSTVVYNWIKPTYDIGTYIYQNFYVGKAKSELEANNLHIAPGLYPEGTEFLHSVRYIGINEDETGIKLANRMKELRYGKKKSWNTYPQLSNAASAEIKEKDAFPDRLRTITGNMEDGLDTGLGWVYQGFIEDAQGHLRPQSYEETLSCIGCHSGIGAITDSTFAFPRKDNTHNNGWYHWSQKDLSGMADRILSNGKGEYAYYLENNGAGDEFRGNEEIKSKFFDSEGNLIQSEVDKIADDITYLINPSIERAILLNKEYKVIVDEQSYIYGKDGHVGPLDDTVYKEVEIDKSTGITAIKH